MKSILPRMYKLFSVFLSLVFVLTAVSCIRDEAPNAEADILECIVPDPDGTLGGKKTVELSPGNKVVSIYVPDASVIGVLSPEFVLTPGATINPPSGTARDFSIPQLYTVTSEDGKWKKEYTVSFTDFVLKQKSFGFENFRLDDNGNGRRYYVFFEKEEIDGIKSEDYIWSSGNRGFALTSKNARPDEYPTASYEYGQSGYGVKLVTRATGSLGELVGLPIAAGNLFLGDFDISNATKEPLKATRFGIPAKIGVPDSLKFWYKFKPGSQYTDKNKEPISKVDKPSMYAVFYEPAIDANGNPVQLRGDNILDAVNQNIIFIAQIAEEDVVISNNIEAADYIHVSLPFVQQQGRTIDYGKLSAGKYYLAIVFSASSRGAYFEGAIGSTLYIDEVELVSH